MRRRPGTTDVAPALFTPSWLCPSEQDWTRFLDLEARIKPMRVVVLVSLFVPGVLVASFAGTLAYLSAVLALVVHLGVNLVSERRRPTALRGVGTVTSFQLVLLAVVATTGGAASPCLPWLAVPNTILATRYRSRVVAVGVAVTVAAAALVCWLVSLGPPTPDYPIWINVACLAGLATACGATSLALQSAEVDSRRAADVDALTGLLNRKPLPSHLERIAAATAATGRTAAVLVCDIDHFKSVNDELGHLRGDDVLRGIAARLGGDARPEDKVFRLGGEEFVVLLPDVDEVVAVSIAERLRAAVAAWPVAGVPVTVSVGLAMLTPRRHDPEQALEAADAALYAAKRGGRNRVCSATHLQRDPLTPPASATS